MTTLQHKKNDSRIERLWREKRVAAPYEIGAEHVK